MSEAAEGKRKRAPKRQRRPRGRLHLTQDKRSGIWQLHGTIRGTPVRESTYTCDAEAADAIRVKRESELLDESIHGRKVVTTFAECVEHYLKVRDAGAFRARLVPLVEYFGDTLAKDMTTTAVHAYAESKHPNMTGISRNAAVVNPIITALRCASKAGICDVPAIQRYGGESQKIVGPGEAWIDEFLAKCDDNKIKAFVMLLTTTGCRAVDARRLLSVNVNYEKQTAFVPQTKNGDPRVLELIEPLVELLKSFPHARNGTVFGWSATAVSNLAIERCCKRIGMKYYSGHKLGRHAIAERLLNQGWTLKDVADAVGWRDIVTLHRKYGHLEQSRLQTKLRDAASGVVRRSLRVVGGKNE